jgi:hypothetical protein
VDNHAEWASDIEETQGQALTSQPPPRPADEI